MYSADILQLIVKASTSVVWYKRDFYRIFETCEVPQSVIDKAIEISGGKSAPKVWIADSVTKQLDNMGNEGLGPLRRIIQQLVNWRDFSSAGNEEQARKAVENLKRVVSESDRTSSAEREKTELERKSQEQALDVQRQKSKRLENLRGEYNNLFGSYEPQKRGYLLQSLLHSVFQLFEMRPGSSFAIVGEQIDGDFTLDGDIFLLEAQWGRDKPTAEEIYGFQGKVSRKFEGTRGLFVSISGFSPSCLHALEKGMTPNILLMDGEDLAFVLEGRVELRELLSEKRRHASRTGEVYLKARSLVI